MYNCISLSLYTYIYMYVFQRHFCWSWYLGQVVEADVPDDEPGITKVSDNRGESHWSDLGCLPNDWDKTWKTWDLMEKLGFDENNNWDLLA